MEENERYRKNGLIIAIILLAIVLIIAITIIVILITKDKKENKNDNIYMNFNSSTLDTDKSDDANMYWRASAQKTDSSNADTLKSVINTALSDYSTASSHDLAEYVEGQDHDIVTSIANEKDIVKYNNINDILAAGKSDTINQLSWEYKVYEGLQSYITEENGSPIIQPKQKDTTYFVKISSYTMEGHNIESYNVQVECTEEDPFSNER